MTPFMHRLGAAAPLIAVLLLGRWAVAIDDLKVMTSGAFTAAYLALAPEFERSSGHRLVTEATSMGTAANGIVTRLGQGEAIDVIIVGDNDLERLIKAGHVRHGTRVDLARSSIGLAVRRGTPKPDISSLDALRNTLLQAKSIAYSASVSGTYLSTELFQKLGIAERVLPKSRRIEGERVGAVVARGDAEIGFQQISELLPIEGIDFVGPLPAEAQHVMTVSAGIGAASKNPDAGKRLIQFLASPAAVPAIKQSGLEPIVLKSNPESKKEPGWRSLPAVAIARARAPGHANEGRTARLTSRLLQAQLLAGRQ
jgi:molybdate transport system substrate-binding protein